MSGIEEHLKHYVDAHLLVHGRTPSTRKYLQACLETWNTTYGALTAEKMRQYITEKWRLK